MFSCMHDLKYVVLNENKVWQKLNELVSSADYYGLCLSWFDKSFWGWNLSTDFKSRPIWIQIRITITLRYTAKCFKSDERLHNIEELCDATDKLLLSTRGDTVFFWRRHEFASFFKQFLFHTFSSGLLLFSSCSSLGLSSPISVCLLAKRMKTWKKLIARITALLL